MFAGQGLRQTVAICEIVENCCETVLSYISRRLLGRKSAILLGDFIARGKV